MKEAITIIGILLTLIAYIPYLINCYSGKTKPHLFSWFVWGCVATLAFALQVSDNAGPGSFVTLAAALICFIIILFGLKNGKKDIVKIDFICLILAFVSIILWLVIKQATLSVIIVCLIDVLGFIPTIRKSWYKPHKETAFTYGLNSFRHILSISALTNYTIVTLLYPLSWSITNGLFVIMLLIRRRKKDI